MFGQVKRHSSAIFSSFANAQAIVYCTYTVQSLRALSFEMGSRVELIILVTLTSEHCATCTQATRAVLFPTESRNLGVSSHNVQQWKAAMSRRHVKFYFTVDGGNEALEPCHNKKEGKHGERKQMKYSMQSG